MLDIGWGINNFTAKFNNMRFFKTLPILVQKIFRPIHTTCVVKSSVNFWIQVDFPYYQPRKLKVKSELAFNILMMVAKYFFFLFLKIWKLNT